MDETQDHRATFQRHLVDDKDVKAYAAKGRLVHQTVFHAASGRKTGIYLNAAIVLHTIYARTIGLSCDGNNIDYVTVKYLLYPVV